jgi:Putative Actinobacterial Holin-X, holin superfamily III
VDGWDPVSTGYTEPDPARGYTGAEQGQDQEISLGERLGNVTRDLSTLMQQEVALAKAEVKQSSSQLGKGIGLLVGAGIGGFFVLLFLSISLWWAIGNATGRGWAALIVAVVWAIIAVILLSVGRKELKRVRGVPTTVDTLGKIPNAVKGKEEDNR